jgi:hypothetical protein
MRQDRSPGKSSRGDGDGYDYDVFVSYKWGPCTKTWVHDFFIVEFEKRLHEILGGCRVFWDRDGIEEGERWREVILAALAKSACIVPIWSILYFQSRWCVAEWETFRRREETVRSTDNPLVVPIRVVDGNDYPEAAKQVKGFDFHDHFITASGFKGTALYVEFEREVHRLAERVSHVVRSAPPHNPRWPVVTPESIDSRMLITGRPLRIHLKQRDFG